MKKYLFGLFAIVIAVSAVAFKPAPKHTTQNYYWFDASLNYTGRVQSHIDEVPDSPCDDAGSRTCELGFSGDDFVTPDVPSSGFKADPSTLVDDEIKKN